MIDLKRIAKRWILPITGSAAAMATIFYLYRDLDFGRFIGGLQDANRWWIAMLAATILLEQLVNGWKWRQVLYDLKPVSSLRLTGAMLAGYGANVLVPLGMHIPGYPPTYSDNIRPFVPGYPPSFDALP